MKNADRRLVEDWEFNVFGVWNYNKVNKLDEYFSYIREFHNSIDGDIVEVGVYRGRSLLATALLLKELGSSKLVYGFDSFSGFPPIYHPADELTEFDRLLSEGLISRDHYEKHVRLKEYRSFLKGFEVGVATISSSGDFAKNSREELESKIRFLGLDNIILVEGAFSQTMSSTRLPNGIFAALVDCDLYASYKVALPYIWEQLSSGGYVFLDEYFSLKFPGARRATIEFCESKGLEPTMHTRHPGEFERWYLMKK
ncbi:macrocin-O-methyltransferase [Legionella pneumophila]|nr:macrocin-O-methyltransferase [Legionella pneumophila]